MDGQDRLSRLPEGCISHIISFTSPRDACRSALVSKTFKSESESDVVWRRFLPPDWSDILSRSVAPVHFSSNKELYFRMCDSILIDGGAVSFSVDKMTGKKCFMLSARELTIIWGDTHYWRWSPHPRSRFSEVAMLKIVWWLEIRGLINSRILSPKTTYAAYLVMGYNTGAYGLEVAPAEASVKLGSQISKQTASLQSNQNCSNGDQPHNMIDGYNRWRRLHAGNSRAPSRIPQPRSDGWVEIELGDCYNDDGDEGDVEMSLMEINCDGSKVGLVIEGIEVRPKV